MSKGREFQIVGAATDLLEQVCFQARWYPVTQPTVSKYRRALTALRMATNILQIIMQLSKK